MGARLRQATLIRLTSDEEHPSNHSESEVRSMGYNPPPPKILLGDYGMENTPADRLIIMNQPANVPDFQLHPSTIN